VFGRLDLRRLGSNWAAVRALVVDDDLPGLTVAENVLVLLGVEVVSAKDGRECIDTFRKHRFDIVFMDHLMPNMGGLEATSEIRKIEGELGWQRTPIVALTASAFPSDINEFFAVGVDDVLLKPYRIDELAERLQKWALRK
jgi:CheY-like chemotaxis protein